jgi:hypothetical protein
MGFGRPARWAGRDEGRAFGLVPVKKDFFRNYFSKRKQFQEILENVLKHENIQKITKKIQENSQRQIGTRTIQIKYLVLMKKIVEHSNK